MKKKIIAITLESLQQLILNITIKIELIRLCNKKTFVTINSKYFNNKKTFVAINSKYFNNNFDAMIYIYIYIVAIKNILFQISCRYRLLFHESYCNRLQILDQNKSN